MWEITRAERVGLLSQFVRASKNITGFTPRDGKQNDNSEGKVLAWKMA